MNVFDPKSLLDGVMTRVKDKGNLDIDNVLAIMTYTRTILETRGTKQTYSTLALYCDWCVHSEIDRHEIVHDLLTAIPETLLGKGDAQIVCVELSKLLDVAGLRKQLIELFRAEALYLDLFVVYDNWQLFMRLLHQILMGRPLQFPVEGGKWKNKKAERKYAEMMTNWGGDPMFIPDKLSLTHQQVDEGTRMQITITTKGQITWNVDMMNTETKDAFYGKTTKTTKSAMH